MATEMNRLFEEWEGYQEESLKVLEGGALYGKSNNLKQYVEKFRACLHKMYVLKKKGKDIQGDETVLDSFEKGFQLKELLARILIQDTLPKSQIDICVALWKTQPYINEYIQKFSQ